MKTKIGIFFSAILMIAPSVTSQHPPKPNGKSSCASGYRPTFHTQGEVGSLANYNFKLVARNIEGKAPGIIFMAAFSGFPLPIFSTALQAPAATGTFGIPGAGTMIYSLPIPNNVNLIGYKLHFQGLFIGGLKSRNYSWAFTNDLVVPIVKNFPKEVEVLYELEKYKSFVTNPAKGLAVWQKVQISGFTYVGTWKFTCGGQSYWMVVVKHNATGIDFSLIPGGSFRMGDIFNQAQGKERPVHYVHLNPFLISRKEITQSQFYAVMKKRPWLDPNGKPKPYIKTGNNYPASFISWIDAERFCEKLGWQLPSEAEWEYACRAGTNTQFYFGNNQANIGQYAWYRGNAWDVPGQRFPHIVGTKKPNSFGLYDMHGNLWECVHDFWHGDYTCAPSDGSAWESTGGTDCVIRGADWRGIPNDCRSMCRFHHSITEADNDDGFRVVVPLR